MEWYPVRMKFDGEVYEDAIRSDSPENALKKAIWNWPDATDIEVI